MRAVSARQMQAIDAAAVARDGESALMTRAGAAIAALVPRYARASGPIVALAGPGNNGGDAFAALAALDATRERVAYHDPATEGSSARRGAVWCRCRSTHGSRRTIGTPSFATYPPHMSSRAPPGLRR